YFQCVKVIAMGFTGAAGYLSDTWNRLDFFIVIAGCAEYVLQEYVGNINLTAIRTIRVLRPLRAVNRIPSMRILVNLLLDTLPMLGNVLLLCFFVFFIFGIVGVQLWAGLLRNRCTLNLPNTPPGIPLNFFTDVSLSRFYIPEDTSMEYICAQPDAGGIHTCQDLPPYSKNGIRCNLTIEEWGKADNESCVNWNKYYDKCAVMHKNPFQGSVSFDNIGFAWVAIFLVISLEGWTDIMYYVQDAHSFWNWIYFVLLIVIGAFFMINLCLVVIATQFAETKRRETERMMQERKRLRSAGSISGSEAGMAASSKDGAGDSVYAAMVRFIGQTYRRTKKRVKKEWKLYKIRRRDRREAEVTKKEEKKNNNRPSLPAIEERPDEENPSSDNNFLAIPEPKSKLRRNSAKKANGKVRLSVDDNRRESEKSSSEYSSGSESDDECDEDTYRLEKIDDNHSRKKRKHRKRGPIGVLRDKIRAFVVCDHFTRGILVAILVNTLSMGVEYHQQPLWLTKILDISNYFFTALFAFEMILKVIADGLFGYLADGFNLFDGGIVALSVLELFQEGKGGLSVLRTFRLLRILKLVRFMPALRYQLVVMLRTMDNVTVFFGLLVLFIFIFSILGMNLFGCKFCKEELNPFLPLAPVQKKCERKNFDTLLWALITVFQILTQEDWNMVLFNGMSQTTPWAALYFVALMTFGNYVLFNLLVAILVEGFQESKEEEKRLLEEEARKKANEEEEKRKHELELLIAKTTSPAFMASHPKEAQECTCTKGEHFLRITAACAASMSSRSPSLTPAATETLDSVRSPVRQPTPSRVLGNNVYQPVPKGDDSEETPRSPRKSGNYDSDSSDDSRELLTVQKTYRLNRHKSLFLPAGSRSPMGLPTRQRLHSWGGVHVHFNPHCPVHGRKALIETYAKEKYLQASQELKQAMAEEEKIAEKKNNAIWRRVLRKTCLNGRADYALFVFSPKNWLRIQCLKITQKKWFDYTILFFIGINCVTLAMERPSIPPNSPERIFLDISGYAFTVIFSLEMLMKVIANGCLIGEGSYFKDGWNILDGILVIISLINVLFEFFASGDSPKIFGVIRVLRLLRALRPLRVINRAPGVKLVVMTLISSLKPIGNIVLICCTFFIIFGILGVQLFKGVMYHCVGPDIANVTTKWDCLTDTRNKWVNHRYNFDNLGQALMSLFVLSSKDGWVSIMYQGIDAVGVDIQPIENYNEWRMIYFISFLLLVGFFVLNMFVGVVVENFHKCKEALEREMREKAREKRIKRKLKRQQFEESMANKKQKAVKTHPYWEEFGPTRLFLHQVVTSKYFDLAIAAVIGINVISMAMEFYMMPMGLKYVLRALNYFFTAVFTLEAGMKLTALGFKRFFRERWNQLDMFIVILSIAGIIFEEFEALELPINPTIIRVMRVLRIARVLKLLKMAKGIRSLLDTVGEALPQVGNLGSLFFLLFFIFAALGVELFGKLECSEEHPCDGLGEHAHFKNFGMAFLTLFRIATGDNWNGIMKDALRDDCNPSERCETNCCVDPILAPCFFVIFVLISQFVLVNVVVAVLMKHLEESNKRDAAEAGAEAEKAAAAAAQSGIDTDAKATDTEAEDLERETPLPEKEKIMSMEHLEKELIEVEERMLINNRITIDDGSLVFDEESEELLSPVSNLRVTGSFKRRRRDSLIIESPSKEYHPMAHQFHSFRTKRENSTRRKRLPSKASHTSSAEISPMREGLEEETLDA
ncbi:hypothetical protein PENTCL1PPCAC_28852, partial [Pristionchus entomophagus]